MYDEIKCDMPLPDGYNCPGTFQTNNLENTLSCYRITSHGRLVQDTDGWFENQRLETPRDLDHHGMVHFYDLENMTEHPDDRTTWTWHEYDAKFTDGVCVEIALSQPREVEDQLVPTTDAEHRTPRQTHGVPRPEGVQYPPPPPRPPRPQEPAQHQTLMDETKEQLENANSYFRRKAAEVATDEQAISLLTDVFYPETTINIEHVDTRRSGIALAKLTAAAFCEIGARSIYITEAGQRFVKSLETRPQPDIIPEAPETHNQEP